MILGHIIQTTDYFRLAAPLYAIQIGIRENAL